MSEELINSPLKRVHGSIARKIYASPQTKDLEHQKSPRYPSKAPEPVRNSQDATVVSLQSTLKDFSITQINSLQESHENKNATYFSLVKLENNNAANTAAKLLLQPDSLTAISKLFNKKNNFSPNNLFVQNPFKVKL
tara:strand:- start:147 stop:557 length:411 start_codon:yes stop_codon:yes gene_type:complete